jgi:cell division ATPase FtsA
MGLFSSSKKEHVVAIFDIGSGSIGGAIAHIPTDPNTLPTILQATRVEIATHEELDFAVFITDVQKALSTVAETLSHTSGGSFDEIVCVLASPWYVSETRMVKMERPRSFIFTRHAADELLQKETSILTDIYQKKYGDSQGAPEIIEHHIMGVSLNGYAVADPLGKKTRSVEMNMIVSLSPKAYLTMMRQTLSQTFHSTPIRFSSFIVASFIAVRDKYISPDSYLLIDVAGEITDVAIVVNGILKSSLSFPFGRNSILKSIASAYAIAPRDAQELFTLWSTGTLEAARNEKVAPYFKSIEEAWGKYLRESIEGLPSSFSLPTTVFLTADADVTKWFSEIIRNEAYIQSINAGEKCTVVTLEGPEFLNMCNVKAGLCDPFLMIEAIAVMRKKTPLVKL